MALIAERPCRSCGHRGPHVTSDGRPPHGEQVNCGACATFLGYRPKPKNIGKRPPNARHRAYWRVRMGGRLRCGICGLSEDEGYRIAFDIDHIWPVEDGGPEDDERNTMPLCRDCHAMKNVERARRLHGSGVSARHTPDKDGGHVAA